MNLIKQIEQWQKDRLLDQQPYDALNEATNIIEELLEGFGFEVPKDKRIALKVNVRDMLSLIADKMDLVYKEPTSEDRLDSIVDQIVLSLGSIMKLGYDVECALEEVHKEINSRTGSIVDGKFQKDTSEEAKAKWVKADYSKCKVNK